MAKTIYLKFIGAGILPDESQDIPLVIVHKDLVMDLNKKAWDLGVRPGDSLRQAKLASPSCKVVKRSPDFTQVTDILSAFTPFVEEDEGGVFIKPFENTVPREIFSSLENKSFLIFSGESSTKLAAKMASSWAYDLYLKTERYPKNKKGVQVKEEKGIFRIKVTDGMKFTGDLPVKYLCGLPKDVILILNNLGVGKIKDLRDIPLFELRKHVGDWALQAKDWASCKDFSKVNERCSQEISERLEINKKASQFETCDLSPAISSLHDRLVKKSTGFREISVKVTGEFPDEILTKTFTRPVMSQEILHEIAISLLQVILQKVGDTGISCVTLIVSCQEPLFPRQKGLWDIARPSSGLGFVMDNVKERFGDCALIWGKESDKEKSRREKMLEIWDPMRFVFRTFTA